MAYVEIPTAQSANIQRVEYDADSQTLRVEFKGSSGVYEYDGVSQDVAGGFERAESAGKYLHNFIKGQYTHRKVR
jgi:hypothetical protein